MADYISIGKPLSLAQQKAIDSRFGPFESINAAYQFTGPNGLDAIYAGLVFCVIANNEVNFYKWTKTNNPTVSDVELVVPNFKTVDGKNITGEGNISTNGLIPFAGVKESGTVIAGTSSATANSNEIYYFTTPGVFGFSIDNGRTYYKRWANEDEFGQFTIFDPNYTTGTYSGNLQGVTPFNNRLYLDCSTFELKGGTNNSAFDNIEENPLNFSEDQRDAINSGITKEIVQFIQSLISEGFTPQDVVELKRLKDMNITFYPDIDTLILTGKSDGEDVTQSYVLPTEGGGAPKITYGNPTISITYETISASGGTYRPKTINISQTRYINNVEDTTTTYTSINDLLAAGGSISFNWTNTTNRFKTLYEDTGQLVVEENTSGSNKTADITVSVTINKKSSSSNITVTQGVTSKLYITSITYNTVDNGDGSFTATPTITASDNQDYSVSDYNNENVETYSFDANIAGLVNSSTGVINYNPSTIISGISAGSGLQSLSINVRQENSEHNISEIPYEWASATGATQAILMENVRGSNGGGKIYKPGTVTYGITTVTITGVNPGDTYLIETTASNPTYLHVWESGAKMIGVSGNSAVIANSSKWTTNAETNYKNFITDYGGKESRFYLGNGKKVVYKAIGAVSYLTFSVFKGYSTDSISYKKLN